MDQPTQPDYSDTQRKLLQATLEVIDEAGFAGATTRRIAERADVNLQLIQYHFGGKGPMLHEAQRYIVDRFFEVVGPVILEAPTLRDAIRDGVRATWDLARRDPAVVQPDLLLRAVRSGETEPRRDRPRATQTRIAEALEVVAGRSGERLRVSSAQFAMLVTSLLGGLVLEYRATGDAERVGAAFETGADLLVTLVADAKQA